MSAIMVGDTLGAQMDDNDIIVSTGVGPTNGMKYMGIRVMPESKEGEVTDEDIESSKELFYMVFKSSKSITQLVDQLTRLID